MAFSFYGPAEEIPKSAALSRSKKSLNPDKLEGHARVKVIHAGAEKTLPTKTSVSKKSRSVKRYVGK